MRIVCLLALVIGIGALVSGGAASAQGARGGPDAEAPDRGAAVYTYWCATCHAAGPNMPGTQALEVKYQGSRPAVLTDRDDLTPAQIAFFVRTGTSVMAPFRKTEITDADLDALTTYITETARTN